MKSSLTYLPTCWRPLFAVRHRHYAAMTHQNAYINRLVTEACRYPPGHRIRQKRLTQIIRLVSKKLWKEESSYYEDALQKTWIYFCQNLCECKTGKAYNADKASVATWLNTYLKRRLQDGRNACQKERLICTTHRVGDTIDGLAAKPDIPPLLQEVEQWAKTAPHLEQAHVFNQPHITARLLILERLPPETPWKVLSARLNVPMGTLSSFYQRQYLRFLREFGRAQGYL